jgi:gas vesicle protein
MNKFLKLFLKTAVYLIDQSTDHVDRAADQVVDRVSDLVDRGKEMIQPEDHTLRNALSFAAGIGVGIGAAVLFAPASGEEIRSSIKDRVQGLRGQARSV